MLIKESLQQNLRIDHFKINNGFYMIYTHIFFFINRDVFVQ